MPRVLARHCGPPVETYRIGADARVARPARRPLLLQLFRAFVIAHTVVGTIGLLSSRAGA
jgi:hypothetical protein